MDMSYCSLPVTAGLHILKTALCGLCPNPRSTKNMDALFEVIIGGVRDSALSLKLLQFEAGGGYKTRKAVRKVIAF